MSSSSSSGSSTPVTPEVTPQTFSSSSPAPPPLLSLQSPELQAEFLKERQNKFQFHDDITSSTTSPSSPSSPCSSSPRSSSTSPSPNGRQARLSLSSPELLTELKESRTRPLRHVPAHTGMTIVFSGRGRGAQGQVSNSAPTAKPANHRISH
ncbi:zinc finger HIT domain-containing protein 1 isoform X2 [Oryzias melastigma]|uniref:zinc finger HIT domain-containing protein 1 isoform X2 n=1 Tax=Oryzias melastigma TaxID=30732 RepID=UPI000CF80DD3|nr:zinc finger HIT domain-containing protein 1 isoform X2 [Oryzias melastigma]XP_024120416.1 zinc finger HIT domain-containing protein 1 isoform X2 [Oryzias melastigma]